MNDTWRIPPTDTFVPIQWKYQGHNCQQHSPKNLENWRKKEDLNLFFKQNTRTGETIFQLVYSACCATESALTLVSVRTVLPTVAFLTMSLSLITLSLAHHIIFSKCGNLSPASNSLTQANTWADTWSQNVHLQVPADICYMTHWQVCCAWASWQGFCTHVSYVALTGTMSGHLPRPWRSPSVARSLLWSADGGPAISRLAFQGPRLGNNRMFTMSGGGAKRDFQQKCGVFGHVRQKCQSKTGMFS